MSQLNLADELEEHFVKCKAARDVALEAAAFGDNTSAAASMINATTNALKELVKLQSELQDVERMKAFERAMIKILREHQDGVHLLEQLHEEVKDYV